MKAGLASHGNVEKTAVVDGARMDVVVEVSWVVIVLYSVMTLAGEIDVSVIVLGGSVLNSVS